MIVTMPDGTDVEFPDDMPRDEIKGMIEKKFPKQVEEYRNKSPEEKELIHEYKTAQAQQLDVRKLNASNVMSDDGLNSQPSSKIDMMLGLARMITPKDSLAGKSFRVADVGVRSVENTEWEKLAKEGAKSAGRQTSSLLVGGTGFMIKMAGDMFYPEYNASDYDDDSVFTKIKKFKDDSNRAVFGTIRDFGQRIEDFSEKVNSSEWLKADEKLFAGGWEDNPNLHKAVDLAMSGVSSLVGMYVLGRVANPMVALTLFSGVDAKDLYEEAREKGVSKGKAFGTWLSGTAGTAALEKFGFEKVFGAKMGASGVRKVVDASKSTSAKIAEGLIAEGGEEGLQTLWQNLNAKIGYDDSRDLFQNVVESFVGGALGGGLVSSFNYGYESFKSKANKAGLTEQEQNNLVSLTAQAIANHPELVDAPLQENMKKNYASFQQMIEEMGDTPEAERLKETKKQLDEVYNRTYEQLKDKVPEKQAKAVSDMARSSALFFADLEGMSVSEWFEKNAPKFEVVDNIGVRGNYQTAYAGSQEDYDIPSLDKIGSNTNVLSQGYGLYYTTGIGYAEKYRIGLQNLQYGVKPYGDVANYIVEKFHKNGITIDQDDALRIMSGKQQEVAEAYKDSPQIKDAVSNLNVREVMKEYGESQRAKGYDPGQIHEVDLPESEFLINKDSTISGQSKFVKDAIKKIPSLLNETQRETYEKNLNDIKNANKSQKMYGLFGRDYYRALSDTLGSDEKASAFLRRAGIKGMEYDEPIYDGHAFVVFDPKDVKVLNKLYGGEKRSAELVNSLNEIQKAKETKNSLDVTKALNSNKGHIEFNMASLKDESSIDYMRKMAKKYGMTEKQFDALLDKVMSVADAINEGMKGSDVWKEWNERQLKTFFDQMEKLNLPIRSAFVSNGDYVFNIDLSTLCVKREFADRIFTYLIEKGYGSQLGVVKMEQIKALMRKYEIAVACDICFVEGKRLNARAMTNSVAYWWDSVRMAIGLTDNLMLGTPRTFDAKQQKILDQMTDRRYIKDNGEIMSEEEYEGMSKGEKEQFKKTHQRVFEKTYEDYMPMGRRRVRKGSQNYDSGITPDMMYTIAKLFRQDSRLAGVLDPDRLMNARDTTALREEYYNTELPSFLGSYAGAGTPKPLYQYNPYITTSWFNDFDRKKDVDKLVQMLYEIGGVRGQSFSDYNEMLVIDYLQKYLDLSIRALPAHEYAKQPALIRTFGDIGVMYNMSLVPQIEKGIDKEHYGLRKATEEEIKAGKSKEGFLLGQDEQGYWALSFHPDSFPVADAMELRKKFDKTSGIIAVGVSDMQIKMMLNDPNVDMVIPFHASGMPAHTKIVTGLVNVDYTDEQETKGKPKDVSEFAYNKALRETGDPRKAAQKYLDWCKQNGYTPKFSRFVGNQNYYKLLEDFRGYDSQGNPIIQGPVDISKADWNRITQEGIKGAKQREDVFSTGETAIFSDDFLQELEGIFQYQQVDTATKNLLEKSLRSVLGKKNVFFLKQDEILEKARELSGEVFRNGQNGTVYGFAQGKQVYINLNTINANTPVHEFSHIWGKVVEQYNPKLWKEGVALLKQTTMWKDVQKDELYWEIQDDENAVAREVLARLSGAESEKMIRQMLDYHTKGHSQDASLVEKIMNFIKEVFDTVLTAFDLQSNVKFTLEDFIRMPMVDLLDKSRHKAFRRALKKADVDGASEYNKDLQYQGEIDDNVYGATNSEGKPIANPTGFNTFIAGSRVTENDEPVSPNNPPKKIYRGDTRYFEEYEAQPDAYEYDWGSAFYLSDSYDDVANNYQSGGADLTNRIEREAEYLADEEGIDYDEAEKRVREEYEEQDIIREFYLSMKNPVIIKGDKETFFDFTENYNEETEDYDEPEGSGVELIEAIKNAIDGDDYMYAERQEEYVNAIVNNLYEAMVENGGLTASEVEDIVRNTEESSYLVDYGMSAGELMSRAFSSMGFDGIIDHRAGTKFRNMDMPEDTTHYIVFNSEQAKSVDNKGQWGTTNKNFYYQGEKSPLGAYVDRIIYLSKNANASTLPHELAHFWSDMLRSSKSERAKEILREVDKWANKEFDRKYSTVKTENGYAVVDKSGKTVYDRMGEGFATEEQARAYAKEELFARGFEKYLREGKAPSKTLRQAFANFYNWLKKIYVDMMSLDIKLSKPMRDVYANILGGTSIDTFLDSNIDQFIERRVEAEQDKDIQVREIIRQAQGVKPVTLPEKIRKAYEEFDFGETWKKLAIPLSTRAKRIAPTLRNKIRRYEFDVMETKQAYYREIEPMLKKWKEFSKEDSIALDLALKNGAVNIRDEILRKYNAVEDFKKVTETLEDIYYKANDAGLEVGYIEDYFPRKVTDKDGLLSYLKGTEDWSGFQQALLREDPYGKFTAEEQAEFIDKYLRGVVRADLASYKYSSEKARKLDVIDNVLNQYYADSMQALIAYIDGMNARISTVNFFGRKRENVDESIGEFVAYLLNNNEIKPSQVDEVKDVLSAVFKRRGVHSKWLRSARDVSYIYTMGGINTAITQLDDIFVAAYKGGVINTISSAFQKDRVTKKDLGIDSIAAEFMTGTGASKAVNWVFKHNGIELIDGFGKNALLNGVLKKMEQMSDADLRKYLEPIMEDETDQTMRDIRNGELSSNVRFFLFNELSDMQPVSLSELPEWYNTGGDGRIFYMLKSFMLKRIDTLRNAIYDKMRSSDKAERIEGWKNMYKLLLLMMIGGATKDLLIDLMYNRDIDLSDTVVNNLLGMVGISKFNIYQAREEGLTNTAAIFVTPPLYQVSQNLAGDVSKYIEGKRELKDFEVFKGLPVIGRFYYWLIGGGKTKMEKRRKKKKS